MNTNGKIWCVCVLWVRYASCNHCTLGYSSDEIEYFLRPVVIYLLKFPGTNLAGLLRTVEKLARSEAKIFHFVIVS